MKKFWQSLHIKLVMIRLSLFKNLHTLALVAIGIIVALVVGGIITEDTPILGWLFGGLSNVFKNAWDDLQCTNVVSAIAPIVAIMYSVYTIVTKFRAIGLSDIKSDKIKLMIIRANLVLYNGFLISRERYNAIKNTSTTSKTDANIITNTINAAIELGSIVIAKIDTETSDTELLNNANSAVTEEELDKATKVSAWSKIKSGLKSFWSKVKIITVDIINIFRKSDDEPEKEVTVIPVIDKQENTEEVVETVEEDTVQPTLDIETVEAIETNDTIVNDTIPVTDTPEIENTNSSELVMDPNATISEDLYDAANIVADSTFDSIKDISEKAIVVEEVVKTVKEINNNTKSNKSNKSSSAADLLSKLNALSDD